MVQPRELSVFDLNVLFEGNTANLLPLKNVIVSKKFPVAVIALIDSMGHRFERVKKYKSLICHSFLITQNILFNIELLTIWGCFMV